MSISIVKALADLGGLVAPAAERDPAAFRNVVKSEIARWSPILNIATAEAK